MTNNPARCAWVTTDPLYQAYHDTEWGVPLHQDDRLFELLVLESAHAGLSWLTILKRRQAYRQHFADFRPERVAAFSQPQIEALLQQPALIRNRKKMESAVRNARAFLAVAEDFGSFDTYLWQFVEGRPVIHHWASGDAVPPSTPLAERISRDLKSRGFSFVGPTIIYAYLQASGVVMDHLTTCFRYPELNPTGQ